MSTDHDWEQWGRRDPYYGVITDPRYRADTLDDAARQAFFASGVQHVGGVLNTCRRLLDPRFQPRRVLDFGCGVGRLLLPFAQQCEQVVGVDVSSAMLDEAARNCQAAGLPNVVLLRSDDQLSAVPGDFDLVHSVITLQHIAPRRGLQILRQLLDRLAPGGLGAIQLTYGKAWYPQTLGQAPRPPAPPPPPRRSTLGRLLRRQPRADADAAGTAPAADPPMLMHSYPLSEAAYLLQTADVPSFHADFTDHGGELGVFLYFQKRPAPLPAPETD